MRNLVVLLFCLFTLNSFAQNDSIGKSPVKFISDKQYHKYKNNIDEEMTHIAEVNNYPSPKKVLKFSKNLNLTETQRNQLKAILAEMNRKAAEMGNFLINEETKFNKLFETNKVNEGSLVYYTNKIGLLQGELRNAYLRAHFRTSRLLTVPQLKKYLELTQN
jgi:Spy/CpxP family protein refolding chaperone